MTPEVSRALDAIEASLNAPASLTDFLKSQLDKKLAGLPDDGARVVFLGQQFGSWTERYRRFAWTGEQPFGGPHPDFGLMSAGDFIITLGMIDGARAKIERQMEVA